MKKMHYIFAQTKFFFIHFILSFESKIPILFILITYVVYIRLSEGGGKDRRLSVIKTNTY